MLPQKAWILFMQTFSEPQPGCKSQGFLSIIHSSILLCKSFFCGEIFEEIFLYLLELNFLIIINFKLKSLKNMYWEKRPDENC